MTRKDLTEDREVREDCLVHKRAFYALYKVLLIEIFSHKRRNDTFEVRGKSPALSKCPCHVLHKFMRVSGPNKRAPIKGVRIQRNIALS